MSIIGLATVAMAAFCIGHNYGQDRVRFEDDRCFVIYDPYHQDSYYIAWFEDIIS